MIQRIWAVAQNTFRETLRQKVLYVLISFGFLLGVFSLFLGELTLGAETKMVKDFGLASMMFFGVLVSILVGVGIVFKEVERRTLYTLLSKPLSRGEFIVGKFLGLMGMLGWVLVIMTVLLFGLLSLYPEPLDWNLLKSVLMIYTELGVLTSVVMLLSSYSSQLMTTIFSIAFLILGHVVDDFVGIVSEKLWGMVHQAQGFEKICLQVSVWMVGLFESLSLDIFSIHARIVHGVPIAMNWILHALFYGLIMIAVILSLAVVMFEKKDLQ